MRRLPPKRNSPSVSLFPFLAVLICTMGALIVLLVLVVQQARVDATVIAEKTEAEQAEQKQLLEQARIEREDQQWRVEVLQTSRDERTSELADLRSRLGHLEDNIRQLEQRWELLKQRAAEIERLQETRQQDAGGLQEQLARTEENLRRARAQLEQAQKQSKSRPKSFALIPYKGPNGTHRRPVYLECTAEGVLLQPEGVLVSVADLRAGFGPGNPLDAVLRTVRNHLAKAGAASEAYPLLVVRPDGIETYGLARAAMNSWDDEFGYELIEEDLQLAYPTADPHLAESARRSIKLARERQKKLQQAMPRSFGGRRGADGYVVSAARGGIVPLNGAYARPNPSKKSGRAFGQGDGGTSLGPGKHGETDSPEAARRGPKAKAGEPTSNGSRSQPGAAQGKGQGACPLAAQRGADFALLNKTPGATGYTRPIRIDCFADRIVMLPEPGIRERPFVLEVRGPLTDAIDPFLQAVHAYIEGWGLAAGGGYWKPDLMIFVAPGGEARFQELEVLLDNSGLVVKRILQP